MKKYKEELQRFTLSDADKQALKQVIYEKKLQDSTPQRKPRLRYAALLMMTVIVLVCVLLPKESSESIHGQLAGLTNDAKKVLEESRTYTPQSFYQGSLGAAGGITKGFSTGTADTYMYGGTLLSEKPTSLPAYETREPSMEEKRTAMLDIVANFGVSSPSLTTEYLAYAYEDEAIKVSQEHSGTISVMIKQPIEVEMNEQDPYMEQYDGNVEFMMTQVTPYVERYLKPFGFDDVSYSVINTRNDSSVILISQKNGNAYDDEKANKMVTFQINRIAEPYESIPSKYQIYANFTFAVGLDVTKIKSYDIIDEAHAQRLLLKGGYYTNESAVMDFTQENILSCSIAYQQFAKSLQDSKPMYILPCYVFQVKTESGIKQYSVIAIQQDELRTLDQIIWYMDR